MARTSHLAAVTTRHLMTTWSRDVGTNLVAKEHVKGPVRDVANAAQFLELEESLVQVTVRTVSLASI